MPIRFTPDQPIQETTEQPKIRFTPDQPSFRGAGATGTWEPERGYFKEAGAALIRGELNVAKGIQGTFAPALLKSAIPLPMRYLLPDAMKAIDKAVQRSVDNISSAEGKFEPTRDDWLGWGLNTLSETIPYMGTALVGGMAVGPIGAATVGFAVEGQNAYDNAINTGASETQAQIERIVVGSINAAIEALQIGKLMKFHKAGAKSLMGFKELIRQKAYKKLVGRGLKFGKELLKTAIEEGLEEFAQEGVSVSVPAIFRGDYPKKEDGSADWWAIGERLGEATMGGMLAGGILGGGGAIGGAMVKKVQTVMDTDQVTDQVPAQEAAGEEIKITSPSDVVGIGKRGLEAEARKYDTFEDFQKAWLGETKHGLYWHVTYDSDFIIDPSKGPRDMSSMASGKVDTGKLMITSDLPTWAEGYMSAEETGGKPRGYAAIVDMSAVPKEKYYQVKRGFGNEFYVSDPGQAKVLAVLPIEKALAFDEAWDKAKPENSQELQKIYKRATQVPAQEAAGETQPETPPIKRPRDRKEQLAIGHGLAKQLGFSDLERRAMMEQITGKDSMKDMTPDEREEFISALEALAEDEGVEYEAPIIDKIAADLGERVKPEAGKRSKLGEMVESIKKEATLAYYQLQRIERFIEDLDGKVDGLLHKYVWEPIKAADEMRTHNIDMETNAFIAKVYEVIEDPTIFIGKEEQVTEGLKLTGAQQVGVYTLAQNEHGRQYLTEGMGISESDVVQIVTDMRKDYKALGDWLMEQYNSQWAIIAHVAASVDIDPAVLRQELFYSPIMRTDIDESEQVDFLDMLTDSFQNDSLKPEQKFLEKRKDRAVGAIELDAAVIYMNNIRRIESFKAMAPVAKSVGTILRNYKVKENIDALTNKQGSKLMNSWMKDVIKGYSVGGSGWFAKKVAILRRNAIIYAIGYNIPTVLRQSLSLSNATAVDPLMLKYVPINMEKATVDYKNLEELVESKSTLVATRNFDRDLRRKWDRATIDKRIIGKDPFDKKATAWIRWVDKHTVVVAWKSFYDVATAKGMNEKEAVAYADKWVARTQPMADTKDLPQFFRDGELARIVSAFQNQVNNNFNFYIHDIIGAVKKGEITKAEAMYRVTFSHVLPAILFGMIGRGGLPKSWKQVAVDVVTYPIASLMLIGRLINSVILGWGDSGSIVGTAGKEITKTGKAIKKGDVGGIIEGAVKSVGAIRGGPTAQMVRTAKGAIDIAKGETKDPRRLIYSKWALEQGATTEGKQQITKRTRRPAKRRMQRRKR